MTYTYAILKVSRPAYDEIKKKLVNAEYYHAIDKDGIIDMHGIALQCEPIELVANPNERWPTTKSDKSINFSMFLGIIITLFGCLILYTTIIG